MQLHLTSILVSLAGLTAVVIWRLRETRSAVTQRKIVIPPLGMATGFSMFILPAFRFPPLWGVGAFLIGYVLLAYPMLLTTRLIREGDAIRMKRSSAFLAVLLVLALIRFLARGYLDSLLTPQQSAAIFFVLAFGMIVRWRVSLLMDFRKLTAPVPA
jgi:membrane protein CcdC involved in cytochrome C biogenesis